jgi:hypothetical protein
LQSFALGNDPDAMSDAQVVAAIDQPRPSAAELHHMQLI